MKKLLMFLLLFGLPLKVKADFLTDQIQTAFVGNAKTAIEFTTKGTTQLEFLDNFIEIGNWKGNRIAALDLGVLGTVLPDSGQFQGINWVTGGKIHLSPIFKDHVTFPSEWQFINTLEIDGRASYDWTAHHPHFGISIGYPFR